MLSVADGVDADVPVLAGGEHVLAVGVHLHVVERRLADHVVPSGELGQPSPAVRRHFSEYYRLVRAAATVDGQLIYETDFLYGETCC